MLNCLWSWWHCPWRRTPKWTRGTPCSFYNLRHQSVVDLTISLVACRCQSLSVNTLLGRQLSPAFWSPFLKWWRACISRCSSGHGSLGRLNLPADMVPRGTESASGYGPGGPNLLTGRQNTERVDHFFDELSVSTHSFENSVARAMFISGVVAVCLVQADFHLDLPGWPLPHESLASTGVTERFLSWEQLAYEFHSTMVRQSRAVYSKSAWARHAGGAPGVYGLISVHSSRQFWSGIHLQG